MGPRSAFAGRLVAESATAGAISAETHGVYFRLGRFASPKQAHPRRIGNESLFSSVHLGISFAKAGRTAPPVECDRNHFMPGIDKSINGQALAPFMCCMGQTQGFLYGKSYSAPPARQNLVKGGSHESGTRSCSKTKEGHAAEAPRFLCGDQNRRAETRDTK